nr:MAG TPA: hypothetical protein [Caudoviricetes sp.]
MLDFVEILRVLKLSECVEQSAIENIKKHLFDFGFCYPGRTLVR